MRAGRSRRRCGSSTAPLSPTLPSASSARRAATRAPPARAVPDGGTHLGAQVVKTDVCAYSGLRIYPGHGIFYVRADQKSFKFINRKSKSQFLQRLNPRKIAWTQLYRRMHKKGTMEESTRKKARARPARFSPRARRGRTRPRRAGRRRCGLQREGWRERAGGSAQTAARVVPGRAGGRTCWSAVAAARFAPRPLRARGVPFAVADPREGPSAALG